MKNVIVGTAGHIDHGKTCLIRALTGTNTDRLKEEQARGITIELGFADLENDMDMDIGIIDVPGHEKFVKHMLAGIGGIDMVLLVVAADEGFMPQTVEHFDIIRSLDIKRGIVVITKIDMVDEDWLQVVEEDVKDHVKGTFLEDAPVVKVSSNTGEGIDELRQLIFKMASECGDRREDPRLLRLPIDRVFTIGGFGTVITGTLMEGSVKAGDEVMIYPLEEKIRVRNVQVHGKPVEMARAGQRTALNITGIKKSQVERGYVIAYPGLLENSRMLDVRIDVFDDSERAIRNGSRVHLYVGSAEVLCKVVLLDREEAMAGESVYAQLRLEEEIAVKRGDKFILRFYSPMETVGGGVILNPTAKKIKRFDERALEGLKAKDCGGDESAFVQTLSEESYRLTSIDEVIRLLGMTKDEVSETLDGLLDEGRAVKVTDTIILEKSALEDIKEKVTDFLSDYHEKNPVSPGIPKEEFKGKIGALLKVKDDKKIQSLMEYLAGQGTIALNEGIVSLPDFTVEYTHEQKEVMNKIYSLYEAYGFEVPYTDQVADNFKNKKEAMQLIDAMVSEGILTRINYQYCMLTDVLNQGLDMIKNQIRETGEITLAQFRDMIGSSRKYAILILDYADEQKITRMEGDRRVFYQ